MQSDMRVSQRKKIYLSSVAIHNGVPACKSSAVPADSESSENYKTSEKGSGNGKRKLAESDFGETINFDDDDLWNIEVDEDYTDSMHDNESVNLQFSGGGSDDVSVTKDETLPTKRKKYRPPGIESLTDGENLPSNGEVLADRDKYEKFRLNDYPLRLTYELPAVREACKRFFETRPRLQNKLVKEDVLYNELARTTPRSGPFRYDPRFDINSPLCEQRNSVVWRVAELQAGTDEYTSQPLHVLRQTLMDYFDQCDAHKCFREDVGDAVIRAERFTWANRYFIKQRGWSTPTVLKWVGQYARNGQIDSQHERKTPGRPTTYDLPTLAAQYQELVIAAGGDRSKVNLTRFCQEANIVKKTFTDWVKKRDSEFKAEFECDQKARELHYEVKRTCVVAKYLEFAGMDHRERRNACVRYFGKHTPGFSQMFIIVTCNKFLRRGTVRFSTLNRKPKAPEHRVVGEKKNEIENTNMKLTQDETDFLNSLNDMQMDLKNNLDNKRRNASGRARTTRNGDANEEEEERDEEI